MIGVLLDTVSYPAVLKKHICNLYSVILFCHLEKKFTDGRNEIRIKQTELADELNFSIGEVRSGFSGLKEYYTTEFNRKEHVTIIRRNTEAITVLWNKVTNNVLNTVQADVEPCEPTNTKTKVVKSKVKKEKPPIVKKEPKPKVEKIAKPKPEHKPEPLYMKKCKEIWFEYLKENGLPPAFNGQEYIALKKLTSDIKMMVTQKQGLISDIDEQIIKSFEIFIRSRQYYSDFHKQLFNLCALNKYSKDIFNSIKNGKQGNTNKVRHQSGSVGETNADAFRKAIAFRLNNSS